MLSRASGGRKPRRRDMPRASDSPTYRASDSQSVATWASDPAGPDAWAPDPAGAVEDRWPAPIDRATDWNPDPATDPAAEWDGRAWGATDRIRSLPLPSAWARFWKERGRLVGHSKSLGSARPIGQAVLAMVWRAPARDTANSSRSHPNLMTRARQPPTMRPCPGHTCPKAA